MDTIAVLFFVFAMIGLYFMPSIVAAGRDHRQGAAILVLNIFLGWTFIGWVIALVWACTNDTKSQLA